MEALEHLTSEDLDRIRTRLWYQFGAQLRKIPEAPTPDDLLHETIEDLLADKRHCPLERIDLVTCLVKIVWSKVSHLYQKWKKEGIVTTSEDILQWRPYQNPTTDHMTELREKILSVVRDDPILERIVEYRLEHPEAKARTIAQVVGVDMQEMYNANRRLKARLKGLAIYSPKC
jgi:hypothetical protein